MSWMDILAGLGVGVLIGGTGIGGGSIMTPILVMIFGIAPAAAVGTDLWFSATTKVVGGVLLHRKGSVDWQVVRRLWCGSLPVSLLTLSWIHYGGVGQVRPRVILVALGWVLLVSSIAMIFKGRIHTVAQSMRTNAPEGFIRLQPGLTVLAGTLLGFLVTLTSVSAGALGTAMLLYIYPFRMKPGRLVGTDIVHAVPLSLVAGTGHLMMGDVDFVLLANLLLGSIPGILLGTLFSAKAPENVLRLSIGVMLALVGMKLLLA